MCGRLGARRLRTTRSSPATRSIGARFQPRVCAERGRIERRRDLRAAVRSAGGRPLRGRRSRAQLTSLNAELAPQLHDRRLADVLVGVVRRPRDRRAARAPARARERRRCRSSCTSTAARPATWSWSFPRAARAAARSQEGYAVFLPNPRGSSGRGQEFARANLGDMGGGDLKDILAGVDALVARRHRGRRARRDHRRQLRRLHVVVGGDADRPLRRGDPVRRRHRLDELPLHDEHRPVRRAVPAGRPDRSERPVPEVVAGLPRAEVPRRRR